MDLANPTCVCALFCIPGCVNIIHKRCIYVIFGRNVIKYTVI